MISVQPCCTDLVTGSAVDHVVTQTLGEFEEFHADVNCVSQSYSWIAGEIAGNAQLSWSFEWPDGRTCVVEVEIEIREGEP